MARELTGKHHYAEFKPETVRDRVNEMVGIRNTLSASDLHVKLSYGNRKTGALVPSVSLIPVADCGNCGLCAAGCYAVRNICCYRESRALLANNSALWRNDPGRYMAEIRDYVKYLRFFRWHASGDIKDFQYLTCMVSIAEHTPTCEFLAFTKMYDLVNGYIKNVGPFPKNLHIIFSDWRGAEFENPYNLPVSSPVWPDGTKGPHCTDSVHMCEGSCSACAKILCGCWSACPGDTILFEAH